MEDKQPELLHFEISSALKSVIGKDLITNDFVALFELVKNSFDARASNVTISFLAVDGAISKIYIVDDGKGMDYDDLVQKWLFVAYSAKQDGTEDNDKSMTYAGNKGVGRFSCDRVGGLLRLESRTAHDSYVHTLNVDWGKFEQDSKEKFEDINVLYASQNEFNEI